VIPGAERWIIGATYQEHIGTPYTRVFDVHPIERTDWYRGIREIRPDAWDWYGQQDRPVYLTEIHPDVPMSVAYPRNELAVFGARGSCALSSSIDHMMALAILERFDVIRLEGIRMNSEQEWVEQRECLAYWIGGAEAIGIQVETDPMAALCTPERIYGFGEMTGARRAPGVPDLVL
jgi:hypothetical protein